MTETLGQRITRLRTEAGMSQGDLADALDISRQSVSKWETDTSTPELEKLIRLAELFDISMDALILGKEDSPPTQEPEPSVKPEPSNSIKLGYQKTPISQTQKIVGLMLIGISSLFALICLVFFAWGGLLTALMLSSPLWGCGILCLTVRKHIGLWCAWTVFMMVTGYLYYATGTARGAIWNPQFWIYGDMFRQITASIENLLLLGLYLWSFLAFRKIRCPFRLQRKQMIGAYIGCIVGYFIFFLLFNMWFPRAILAYMAKAELSIWNPLYHILTFCVSMIDLFWILVLLLGARMLYNEHKAAKNKIA